MKTVEFIQDFGSKKKGEKADYDPVLASNLVREKRVAKYFVKPIPSKKAEKVESKPEAKKVVKGK